MLEYIAMMNLETGEDKRQTTDKGYVLETGKEVKKKRRKKTEYWKDFKWTLL